MFTNLANELGHHFAASGQVRQNRLGQLEAAVAPPLRPAPIIILGLNMKPYGDFHSHRGTPKWLVYHGKSCYNGCFWGVPPYMETPK